MHTQTCTFPSNRYYGLIIDSHNDQLSVGLIAQLVEHCTGMVEVRDQVPSWPEFGQKMPTTTYVAVTTETIIQ